LGLERCVLLIVEGNSPNGTGKILEAMRPRLESLGITYFYQTSPLNPLDEDRIGRLARLRNAALRPIFDNPEQMSDTATVVFLNDVLAYPEDALKLTLQLRTLDADMSCAMDWNPGEPPWFYDSWISRGIKGDTFFEFPESKPMGWDHARLHNLF
jgi:alpha-1,3-mannosyltransferase